MSGTTSIVMGDSGQLVIPSEIRQRHGMSWGTRIVLAESDDGLVLTTVNELLQKVRDDYAGLRLADDLIADRRREADNGRFNG